MFFEEYHFYVTSVGKAEEIGVSVCTDVRNTSSLCGRVIVCIYEYQNYLAVSYCLGQILSDILIERSVCLRLTLLFSIRNSAPLIFPKSICSEVGKFSKLGGLLFF